MEPAPGDVNRFVRTFRQGLWWPEFRPTGHGSGALHGGRAAEVGGFTNAQLQGRSWSRKRDGRKRGSHRRAWGPAASWRTSAPATVHRCPQQRLAQRRSRMPNERPQSPGRPERRRRGHSAFCGTDRCRSIEEREARVHRPGYRRPHHRRCRRRHDPAPRLTRVVSAARSAMAHSPPRIPVSGRGMVTTGGGGGGCCESCAVRCGLQAGLTAAGLRQRVATRLPGGPGVRNGLRSRSPRPPSGAAAAWTIRTTTSLAAGCSDSGG